MNYHEESLFEQPELAPALEWMLESRQVDDSQVVVACVQELYPGLLALAHVFAGGAQKSFNHVIDTICEAVQRRQHYWSGISARAWVFRILYRRMRPRFWRRNHLDQASLHLVLCDGLGLSSAETAAVLDESPAEAEARLEFRRKNRLAAAEAALDNAIRQRKAAESLASADVEKIRQLVLSEAHRLGRQSHLSISLRQSLLALVVLAGVLGLLATWSRAYVKPPAPPPRIRYVQVTATTSPTAAPQAALATHLPTAASPAKPTPITQVNLDVIGPLVMTAGTAISSTYSGPDSLYPAMNYWHVLLSPAQVRSELQPGQDAAVQFHELKNYALANGLAGEFRLGGDLNVLRRLLDAGFPVILQLADHSWNNWDFRYVLVSGYNYPVQVFITAQVDPSMGWQQAISFGTLEYTWQFLNNPFLVLYDPKEPDARDRLMAALDIYANPMDSYYLALDKASKNKTFPEWEFFSQLNAGTAFYYLRRFDMAAATYNEAFSIFADLPEDSRPNHILWYQSQVYAAYFAAGSYQKIIELATKTIQAAGDTPPDDSFYYRGMAYNFLGDIQGFIEDMKSTLRINPQYAPARELLGSCCTK